MSSNPSLGVAYLTLLPTMKGSSKVIEKELGGVPASKIGSSMGARLTNGFKAVSTVTMAAAGTALGVALTKGFGRLKAIDQAQAKLRGLGNDSKTIEKIMTNATAAVKGTAFGLDEAATAAAGAMAAGVKPGKELERNLKLVADAATIAGTDMGSMGAIFNKVAASNKVQMDVINQLHDAGVPALSFLAKTMGVTSEEASKMASAGEIDFATFQKAMEEGLGGAAQSSGDTFSGAMANVFAALGRIGAGIMGGVFPKLAPLFQSIQAALGPVEDQASRLGEVIGNVVSPMLDRFVQLLEGGTGKLAEARAVLAPAAGAFAALGASGLAPLIGMVPGLGGLAGALARLGGPLGIAAGLFIGLVSTSPELQSALSDLLGAVLGLATSLAPYLRTVAEIAGVVLTEGLRVLTGVLTETASVLSAVISWVTESDSRVNALATTIGIAAGAFVAYRVALAAISFAKLTAGLVANTAAWVRKTAAMVADKWATVQIIGLYVKDFIVAMASKTAALARSGAAWVANTAKLVANRVALLAHQAGLKLWIQLAAMQAASLWRTTTAWVRNTAVVVGQKVALVASTVATKAAAAAQALFNAALKANPIGLVITAVTALVGAVVWFFTQTEAGREIFAAVVAAFAMGWEQIKAGFAAVTAAFVAGWDQIRAGFAFVVSAFALGWEQMKAGLAAVRDFFVGIWTAITEWISTKINQAKLIIAVGVLAIRLGWEKTWSAVQRFFVSTWTAIVTWVTTKINQAKQIIALGLAVVRTVWSAGWTAVRSFFVNTWTAITSWLTSGLAAVHNLVRSGVAAVRSVWSSTWTAIKNTFVTIWSGIKSTLTTMINFVKTKPAEAFRKAKDGIVTAWNKIKDAAKTPVKFVLQKVINDGLIGTINKIPGVNIAELALPKGFHDGGYTGAMAATKVAGVVHGDEHVIRSASRRAIEARHPGVLDHMNRHGSIPGYKGGGFVTPLPRGSYSVSQPFHSGHNGIDLAAPTGTKTMAAAAGRITHAGWEPGGSFGGGNQVNVLHDGNILTWYAHLSSIAARVGQQVRKGQTIGRVGSTGNSTGPHLHYMIETGYRGSLGSGNWINPAPFMSGHTAPSGGDGGWWNPLDGLVDWVKTKITDKFPGGGMWVDAAAGLAKQTAENAVKHFTSFIGKDDHGQASTRKPLLFDNGGWLPTGVSLVENRTGRPEPIFTGDEFDRMVGDKGEGGGPDRATFEIYDTDGVLVGVIDGRIKQKLAPASRSRAREELGV
ncbi:hypothetical protein K8P10_001992 [Leucobacter sp. Psy1]|uniref:peptidoglycan DD-metalloendopeptidase family protein n=1 Tax=Leucobacter sp. Psy1 TaxID=2875729 RepID=UPI001CD30810|nr:peptidoglycan DD-metalloendopeptidase family protein [Leucobacter sp. Psy1]UBH06481.1 hypothetical protein K8P10_001992 [Leucobacter sp. Psy1]